MPSTGLMVPYKVSISSEPHGGLLRQVFNPHIFFVFVFGYWSVLVCLGFLFCFCVVFLFLFCGARG